MIKNETPYKRYIYALDILAFGIGKPKQRRRVELMHYAAKSFLKSDAANDERAKIKQQITAPFVATFGTR